MSHIFTKEEIDKLEHNLFEFIVEENSFKKLPTRSTEILLWKEDDKIEVEYSMWNNDYDREMECVKEETHDDVDSALIFINKI